jgi:hypothetical protein
MDMRLPSFAIATAVRIKSHWFRCFYMGQALVMFNGAKGTETKSGSTILHQ